MQLLLIQEAENKILSLKKDQDYKFYLASSSILVKVDLKCAICNEFVLMDPLSTTGILYKR
jgi:hypothetical protein